MCVTSSINTTCIVLTIVVMGLFSNCTKSSCYIWQRIRPTVVSKKLIYYKLRLEIVTDTSLSLFVVMCLTSNVHLHFTYLSLHHFNPALSKHMKTPGRTVQMFTESEEPAVRLPADPCVISDTIASLHDLYNIKIHALRACVCVCVTSPPSTDPLNRVPYLKWFWSVSLWR